MTTVLDPAQVPAMAPTRRGMKESRPPHGRLSRYTNYRCRCDLCKEANRRYKQGRILSQGRNAPFVATVAPIRQLRALVAYGYELKTLARLAGRTPQYMSALACMSDTQEQRFTRVKVEEVDALYDRLLGQPIPTGASAERARRHAAARGWVGAEAWTPATIGNPSVGPGEGVDLQVEDDFFDEVVVERALASTPGYWWGGLRAPDRTETLRRLFSRGTSVTSVAALLHSRNSTIMEWRDRYLPQFTPRQPVSP